MARATVIYTIPEEVRHALNREIVSRGFTSYDHLVLWLEQRGYQLSRSAIHRYATTRKDEIIADVFNSKAQDEGKNDLRMRALEVASRSDPDPSTLINRAEKYLEWARSNHLPIVQVD